ncbi:MAG: TonB-dependent receptor [Bacteroidota bacterium]
MKKKLFTIALMAIIPILTYGQFSITGKISDVASNEVLVGATITIQNSFSGVYSNTKGTYTLKNLKAGKYNLQFSYIGYKTIIKEIDLNVNLTIDISLERTALMTDEVIVKATRATDNSPTTYSTLQKSQLEKTNLGQDITYMMNTLPSVVVTSDAGGGVGYTGIRIRGTDPTRINVTINGIPYNDAESQGSFWVDLPDFTSSIENMQIQRGVGTSTNGAGAFGASINIQTTKLNQEAYATYSGSFGSFNTAKNTMNFGTGLINNKFTFDGRVSNITSDGFIDRAFSDMKSYYLSGAYYGKKDILRIIAFSGLEKTYQAWYGVPKDSLETNRTFNPYTYKNQIDYYQQDNYQALYSHEFNQHLNFNAALHYTYGSGYYEEYKEQDDFSSYGLNDLIINTDTITTSDLIRRRWLSNDFYGATWAFNYSKNKLNATFGGAANQYLGRHFGNVIWAQYASNSKPDNKYYNDKATKTDVNEFVKVAYQINNKFNTYFDLQYRTVNYAFTGFNDSLMMVDQDATLSFINPKIGLSYKINNSSNIYASFATGNKEPNRNDYVDATPISRPKSEKLENLELGYKLNKPKFYVGATCYYMYYTNQLVLTGKLNDVGAYTRTNIPKSYRAGLELEGGYKICKNLEASANVTFSENKIMNFTEYIDNWDDWSQSSKTYSKTDIAFSPNIISSGAIVYQPIKNAEISWISKYVGKQFLDNTSNNDRSIDPYFTNDLRLAYNIKPKFMKEISFNLSFINILDEMYESNGWSYTYISGGTQLTDNYYYPQAGRHFLVGLTLKF